MARTLSVFFRSTCGSKIDEKGRSVEKSNPPDGWPLQMINEVYTRVDESTVNEAALDLVKTYKETQERMKNDTNLVKF